MVGKNSIIIKIYAGSQINAGSFFGPQVIVITHPWGLCLICKHNTWGQSVYKSDTKGMDVIQLLCFMVRERIKGDLSLCLAWRTILYCWSCPWEWCRIFSWWKTLIEFPCHWSRVRITMPSLLTFLAFGFSTNILLMLLTSWLLALYARKYKLHHGKSHVYIFTVIVCYAKLERSLTLLRLGWWKLASSYRYYWC